MDEVAAADFPPALARRENKVMTYVMTKPCPGLVGSRTGLPHVCGRQGRVRLRPRQCHYSVTELRNKSVAIL